MVKKNTQSSSSKQGKEFEEIADAFLVRAGFMLEGKDRSNYLGIEFDQIAWWPETSKKFLVEHKGSFQGNRPGLMRTDTVKKALLSGFLNKTYEDPAPYFIITSHIQSYDPNRVEPLDEDGNLISQDWNKIPSGLKMLEVAIESGALDAVWVIGNGEDESLVDYSKAKLEQFMDTGVYEFWDYVEHVSGRNHRGPYGEYWYRHDNGGGDNCDAIDKRELYLENLEQDPDFY